MRELAVPIVQAPMGGGISTPALAAAVCGAGGLGFLAAGYREPDAVAAEVAELRSMTDRPFGLNLFAPSGSPADPAAVERYAARIAHEGELGEPRHDDDHFEAKLALAAELAVPVVSTTFGSPTAAQVEQLHAAGCAVWVTVTAPAEAELALAAGPDALVLQGFEAGGHRGAFDDRVPEDLGLLTLLRLVAAITELPLIASGGISDGAGIAAVLAAGPRRPSSAPRSCSAPRRPRPPPTAPRSNPTPRPTSPAPSAAAAPAASSTASCTSTPTRPRPPTPRSTT